MARSVDPPGPEDLSAEWGRYGVDDDQLSSLTAAGVDHSILGDMADAGPSENLVYFGQDDDPIGVEDFFRDQSDDWWEPPGGLTLGADGIWKMEGRAGYGNNGESPEDIVDPVSGLVSTVDKSPADISVSPTTTSNPNRPRTVAAGFDPARRVLTVIFRDGTYYNYYDISPGEWQSFKRQRSKGFYIKTFLDSKRRGMADMAAMPLPTQELIYRVSRTNQIMREGAFKKPAKQGGGLPDYTVRKKLKQFQKVTTTKTGKSRVVTTKTPKWQGAPAAFYARYGTRYR